MATPFTITAATLPLGTCFTTPNAFAQLLASILQITWTETDSLFNFGNVTPIADDQDRPWIRTNSDGSFDHLYTFVGGQWISPHYINPGFTMEYSDPATGTYLAAMSNQSFFDPLDGGNSNPVTLYDGPFWQLNSPQEGRWHVQVDVNGQTYFPAGKQGPAANDPNGFQPSTPYNPTSNLPYVVVPVIRRSIRQYYTIPAA